VLVLMICAVLPTTQFVPNQKFEQCVHTTVQSPMVFVSHYGVAFESNFSIHLRSRFECCSFGTDLNSIDETACRAIHALTASLNQCQLDQDHLLAMHDGDACSSKMYVDMVVTIASNQWAVHRQQPSHWFFVA